MMKNIDYKLDFVLKDDLTSKIKQSDNLKTQSHEKIDLTNYTEKVIKLDEAINDYIHSRK